MGEDELSERDASGQPRILKIHEVTPNERAYYEEADALRQARIRYAQAFQIAKHKGGSDELARQTAIEMTGDEITLREAVLKIAEERL